MAFGHLRRETGPQNEVFPAGFATNPNHDFWLQAMHVSELKQEIIVHGLGVFGGGVKRFPNQTV